MYNVYALVDPRDSHVRYIGCTCQRPSTRLRKHMEVIESHAKRVNAWITELKGAGCQPVIVPFQTVKTKAQALDLELYWIKHFQHLGSELLNVVGMHDSVRKKMTYQEKCRHRSEGSKRGHLKRGHKIW